MVDDKKYLEAQLKESMKSNRLLKVSNGLSMKQNQKIKEFLKKNMPGFDDPRNSRDDHIRKDSVGPMDISE